MIYQGQILIPVENGRKQRKRRSRRMPLLAKSLTCLKSTAPILRICIILLTMMMLVATYCDDFNPTDKYIRGIVEDTEVGG
jgi:hypothetical protein